MHKSGSGAEPGTGSKTDDYPDIGKGSVAEADTGSLTETGMGQVTGWGKKAKAEVNAEIQADAVDMWGR